MDSIQQINKLINNIVTLSELLYFFIVASYFLVAIPFGPSYPQQNYMMGDNTLHVAKDV